MPDEISAADYLACVLYALVLVTAIIVKAAHDRMEQED